MIGDTDAHLHQMLTPAETRLPPVRILPGGGSTEQAKEYPQGTLFLR